MKGMDLFKIFALVCMMVGFGACSDDNDTLAQKIEQEEEAVVACSVEKIDFESSNGNETLSFSTNKAWIIKVLGNVTWCKVNASSGNAGTHSVNVSVEKNNTYVERNVSLAILCDDKTHTIIVTQKQQDILILSQEENTPIEVESNGGKIEIAVKTNIDYEVEIVGNASQWIKESNSRSMASYSHVFSIEPNENKSTRSGLIRFKTSEQTYTVKVSQKGNSNTPILIVDKKEYIISALGETIEIKVESNLNFGVDMDNVDWIKMVEDSRGFSEHTLRYVVLPNETYEERTAEIVVYDKNSNLKETIRIVQKQKDLLQVLKKSYEIGANKETIEVEVNCNIDFEIQINAEWITFVKQTIPFAKKRLLYFEVEENLLQQDRKGKIVITNEEKDLEQTIDVLQEKKEKVSTEDKNPDGNIDDMIWG